MNRHSVKNWAITFPQTEMGREDFLRCLPPCEEAFVAREEHKDGGFHLHCGIKLKKGITKKKMLDWLVKKFPNDYKRIDVQATRSIKNWKDYIGKEDPEVYEVKDLESTMVILSDKLAKLKEKCGDVEDLTSWKENNCTLWAKEGLKVVRERLCEGCDLECQECEKLWAEYRLKLDL